MEQEEKLCEDVKTEREFTYLGDRVSACVGYKAAVTARTRCGWVKFGVCGGLLYDRSFPLKLQEAVYESYVPDSSIVHVCATGQLQANPPECGLRLFLRKPT